MNFIHTSRIILFGLLIAAGSLLVVVPASGQDGWATVDTRILLMLHPQMNGFDYSNGRFFRDQTGRKDVTRVINDLKAAHEKADKDTKALKEQQQKLFAERFQLVQQQTRATGSLAPGDLEKLQKEKASLDSALQELNRQAPANRDAERLFAARKVDLADRIAILNERLTGLNSADNQEKLAAELQEKIAKLDKQLTDLAGQIAAVEEKAVSAVYLTSEETEARLQTIRDEISSLIKKAAAESKVATVIDASFAMRSPERKDRMKMIPAVDESPDVVSSSLFHSFNNLTIDPELQKNVSGPDGSELPAEHLVVGRAIGMQSNLTQYLEFRHYLPEKVADFSHGRLFISGGTDLTPWVARQLFDRYKVPDSVKNSFMMALRSYLNFDKEPVTRERDY